MLRLIAEDTVPISEDILALLSAFTVGVMEKDPEAILNPLRDIIKPIDRGEVSINV